MKKAILACALLLSLLLPSIALIAYAHPGGTDGSGGHRNRSTGEYHYHHGYSAHDHYDMDGDGAVDCPYGFDDQTGSKNRSGSSKREDSPPLLGGIIAVVVYVFFMFVLPAIMTK